jgi:hypothetical protein
MEKKISSWIAIGTGLVALITGILTININNTMTDLDAEQKKLGYVRDSTDFSLDRDFKFKIYQLVVDAVDKKSENILKQRAATTVVNEMVDDKDADFKLGLLAVLNEGSDFKDIQNSTANKIFALEETLKAKVISTATDLWRVEVFYVEGNRKTAEQTAANVATLLNSEGYKAKVRLLPDAVNSLPAYRISSNEIRYEESEKEEALKIVKNISEGLNFNLGQKQIRFQTSKYISIFIFQ